MSDPYFFGYGSLVNLSTHSYADTHAATLAGYRRVWRDVPSYDAALLSIEAHEGHSIKGVIAQVPRADWSALDQRESGYNRHLVTEHITCSDAFHPSACSVYQVPEKEVDAGKSLILLSYLDVVIQGFLHIHGSEGAAHFFVTTQGWERGILDDRDAPKYPRHRQLSNEEIHIVDQFINTQHVTKA